MQPNNPAEIRFIVSEILELQHWGFLCRSYICIWLRHIVHPNIYRTLSLGQNPLPKNKKFMLLSHLRLFASWALRGGADRSHSRDNCILSLAPAGWGTMAEQRGSDFAPAPPRPPSHARSRHILPLAPARWGGGRGQPWERARRDQARLGEKKGRPWEGGRIGGADARV